MSSGKRFLGGFPTYKANKNCKHSQGLAREEDGGYAVPENVLPDGRERGSNQRAALSAGPLWQDNRVMGQDVAT